MAAHQALPSLGFSRQERWSGFPFPSPMHESEKWKWSGSVMSNSLWPHGLQPTRLLRPWDFSRQEYWSGLPLPSPISLSVMSNSLGPHGLWPARLLYGILQERILEWVAVPFFRGSSWPRDQTQISYIRGRFFFVWTTREALVYTELENWWPLPLKVGKTFPWLKVSSVLYLLCELWHMNVP